MRLLFGNRRCASMSPANGRISPFASLETTDGRAASEESTSFSSSSPTESTGSDAEDPKEFKDNFRRIKARYAATANRPNDAAQVRRESKDCCNLTVETEFCDIDDGISRSCKARKVALLASRFRMSRVLFNRIVDNILEHDYDGYFTQKRSACGLLGLHPLQKMTAAMRMLTYGIAADGADEYIRSAEATNLEACKKFVIKVCEIFGDKYLRSPNEEDTARLLALGEERGFPAEGEAPEVNYTVNGHQYTMGYYLADGIYPKWATFVKTIPSPPTRKKKHFSQRQEAARKDVERAFGVLQSRFAIVRGPAKGWKRKEIGDVMKACVIMHNMIVEEERHTD
ncbi:uncharacterized protein LOC124665759 [Lolium rigidum]|uniref:uncharacterized protein LOC124665759 n=1 Tax=Lolium rigidum TaxID=89674 RepID=UPI001F5C9303|nr:uncharacterized protein LOC124665759 [Lolium rigidum]